VDSALEFERRTMGRLSDDERQRFHEEQMLAAEMLGLPRTQIPPTVAGLHAYVDSIVESDRLIVTDAAQKVAALFREPPKGAQWRPVLRAISWWAFGTLPPRLRAAYGIHWDPAREAALRGSLLWLRSARPMLPHRFRRITPAQRAEARVKELVWRP